LVGWLVGWLDTLFVWLVSWLFGSLVICVCKLVSINQPVKPSVLQPTCPRTKPQSSKQPTHRPTVRKQPTNQATPNRKERINQTTSPQKNNQPTKPCDQPSFGYPSTNNFFAFGIDFLAANSIPNNKQQTSNQPSTQLT
jgi:hypothetical protein